MTTKRMKAARAARLSLTRPRVVEGRDGRLLASGGRVYRFDPRRGWCATFGFKRGAEVLVHDDATPETLILDSLRAALADRDYAYIAAHPEAFASHNQLLALALRGGFSREQLGVPPDYDPGPEARRRALHSTISWDPPDTGRGAA